jgi:hypothetical protein
MGKMMRTLLFCASLLFSSLGFAYGNCDISQFKWECDLKAKPKPSKYYKSLVYCGDTLVAISESSRKTLNRYVHANINMVLKVNGEFIDAPCKKYPY